MWESPLGHSKHRQTWWKRDGFGWQFFFWVRNLSDSFLSIIIFILGAGGEDWHDSVLWMQSDECNIRLCHNVHSHQKENKNNFLAWIVEIKASGFFYWCKCIQILILSSSINLCKTTLLSYSHLCEDFIIFLKSWQEVKSKIVAGSGQCGGLVWLTVKYC